MPTEEINKSHKDILIAIEEGDFPRYIYQYKANNHNTLKMFINSEIYCNSPKNFNDPFDCKINVKSNYSQQEIEKFFSQWDYSDLGNEKTNYESFKKECLKNNSAFVNLIHHSFNEIRNKIGVACFSKNNDNLLLWSHYADSHKGICVKFDVTKSLDFFENMNLVRYSKEYAITDYINNKTDIIEKGILMKSKDWEYEEEVRVWHEGSKSYPINREAIQEVIFGLNISDNEIETYINLFVNSGYNYLKLKKAILNPSEFKIDFLDITHLLEYKAPHRKFT